MRGGSRIYGAPDTCFHYAIFYVVKPVNAEPAYNGILLQTKNLMIPVKTTRCNYKEGGCTL